MFCLEDNTERSESNPGRSLGIKTKEGGAVWKTVPCRCMLIAFFICFGTVFQTILFVILYIPRLRPGLHESGCYMAGWHNVVINMVLLAKYLKHMKK